MKLATFLLLDPLVRCGCLLLFRVSVSSVGTCFGGIDETVIIVIAAHFSWIFFFHHCVMVWVCCCCFGFDQSKVFLRGMVNTGIERSSAGWNFYDLFTLKRRVMKETVESSSSPCPCSLALFSFHLLHCSYCCYCSRHSVDDDDGAEWSQPEFDVCVASWPTDHPSS